MQSHDEKARRRGILQSQREEERNAVREGLPVPLSMMKALLNYVDQHLSLAQCDDTLRFVREFIQARGLTETRIVAWLENAGAYCDCEAISNAEQILEDAVPGYNDLPPPKTSGQ